MIFPLEEVSILETRQVSFLCNCNRERLYTLLGGIEASEIQEMLDDNQPIEMICHFCRERYEFQPEELEKILSEKNLIQKE